MADHLQSSAEFSALVWFRDDLRLADHPALTAGAKAGTLTCLYLLDEDSAGSTSTWRRVALVAGAIPASP